ncbi:MULTISPECIES: OadG family protein [Ruminococcus]|uniref:OadG family protein n=1 Tax=Ruminococcus TaxID=1263 RepID=UPI000339F245|nr:MULTISPECIES: OadG family protein [Ruminococcus]CDD54010.1 oxaloacetate decarboxylase gamma chain [Ruminococcus sp. CAG:379]
MKTWMMLANAAPLFMSEMNGNEKIPFTGIIAVTLTGFAVVFLGLIILIAFVSLLGKFFESRSNKSKPDAPSAPKQEQKPAPKPAPKSPAADLNEEQAVVAAICAAISAMGEAEGTTYAVKSIRPKQAPVRGARPAWYMAGLRDNTTPF